MRRAWAVVLLCLALLGSATGTASAHALLESSTPLPGQVLTVPPASVRLHFGEAVQVPPHGVRLLDPAGHQVLAVAPHVSGTDVVVAVPAGLAQGSYLVVWRVVSADSHPVDGSFSFSVGHSSTVASAPAPHRDRTVAGLLAAARALGYLGLATFVGGVWFVLLCWPEGRESRRSRRLLAGGWATALSAAVVASLLQGPYGEGSGLAGALHRSMVADDLGSRYGHAVEVRCLLLTVAAAVAVCLLRRRSRLIASLFTLVVTGVFVTFAWTGHAGVGRAVPLAVLSDVVHLSAMSLWLGGLLQLEVAVLPTAQDRVARRGTTRFSAVAGLSVVALVASGLYQAWRQASPADLTSTYYGRLLLTKTGVVVLVLAVAVMSRRWVLRHGLRTVVSAHLDTAERPALHEQRPPVGRLRLTVAVETLLLVVVLAVTSLLVSAPPARTATGPLDRTLDAGPVSVHVMAAPAGARTVSLHIEASADVAELRATLSSSSRGVRDLAVPLLGGPRAFTDPALVVPYAGAWSLTLRVRTSEVDEYAATVVLHVG